MLLWVVNRDVVVTGVRSQREEHLRLSIWVDDVSLIELAINIENDVQGLLRYTCRFYIGFACLKWWKRKGDVF